MPSHPHTRRGARTRPLRLEALEDRVLLAAYTHPAAADTVPSHSYADAAGQSAARTTAESASATEYVHFKAPTPDHPGEEREYWVLSDSADAYQYAAATSAASRAVAVELQREATGRGAEPAAPPTPAPGPRFVIAAVPVAAAATITPAPGGPGSWGNAGTPVARPDETVAHGAAVSPPAQIAVPDPGGAEPPFSEESVTETFRREPESVPLAVPLVPVQFPAAELREWTQAARGFLGALDDFSADAGPHTSFWVRLAFWSLAGTTAVVAFELARRQVCKRMKREMETDFAAPRVELGE